MPGLVLRATAQAVGHSVQSNAHQRCALGRHEELLEVGHVRPGEVAERGVAGGHPAPAEDGQVLLRRDLLNAGLGLCRRDPLSVGRKALPTAYAPCLGKLEIHFAAEETVRDLQQHAGAVTGLRI